MMKYAVCWDTDTFSPGQHPSLVSGDQMVTIVDFEFFTEDLGYSVDDIESIAMMYMNEIWISADYGMSHRVWRIG